MKYLALGLILLFLIGCGAQLPPNKPPQDMDDTNYNATENNNDYVREEPQAENITIDNPVTPGQENDYINEESN